MSTTSRGLAAGGGHLVVLHLHLDVEPLQGEDHLAAEVLELVVRRDREIPLLRTHLVAEVRVLAVGRVPVALDRVDLVGGVVHPLAVFDVVEDEVLRLGSGYQVSAMPVDLR